MITTYQAWERIRRELFRECGGIANIYNGGCIRRMARLAAAIDFLDAMWEGWTYSPLYAEETIDQLRCDCPQCGQRVLPATLEPPGSE